MLARMDSGVAPPSTLDLVSARSAGMFKPPPLEPDVPTREPPEVDPLPHLPLVEPPADHAPDFAGPGEVADGLVGCVGDGFDGGGL